jgi:pimeloyl-ACP methyl ester carboxylesterase
MHLAQADDQFFSVDGFRIRYREIGHGEPVVLLHGRGSSLDAWNWLGDSLATDYRVIAIDERGFGQSTKSGDPSRYGKAMSHDVLSLLDHLHLQRAHLVGHSQGAAIAAFVAATSPGRVTTAFLLAGPFFADSAAYAAFNDPFAKDLEEGLGLVNFYKARGVSDSIAAVLNAEMLAHNDAPSLAAATRSLGGLMIPRARAHEIRVPAVVMVGTRDDLLEHNRELASWWPGARLIEVSNATHISILRQPDVLHSIRERLHARPLRR